MNKESLLILIQRCEYANDQLARYLGPEYLSHGAWSYRVGTTDHVRGTERDIALECAHVVENAARSLLSPGMPHSADRVARATDAIDASAALRRMVHHGS